MGWRGHYWTLRAFLERLGRRSAASAGEPWDTEVDDPDVGRIRLTGRFRPAVSEHALVIVHGMGGSAESEYVLRAAAVAERVGLSSLALNVRGADRLGEDYFHAALTTDLAAAVASPELAPFRRIGLLGYSLGGHLSLVYASESPRPRVGAVAAISAPLDLAACCETIDRPGHWLYRRYLLHHLCEIYAAVARRRPVPVPVDEARRIRTQREFDDRIVAPRHGFDGVEDYYRRASVGPRLARLRVPSLIVSSLEDPLVPSASLEPYLGAAPDTVEVHWVEGGHVGFPGGLDLGREVASGLEPQVVAWLEERLASGGDGGSGAPS